MRRLVPVAILFCAMSLLAGCQMSRPGKLAEPGTNAVTGDAIEVTPLDVLPEDGNAKPAAGAGGMQTAAPQAAPQDPTSAPPAEAAPVGPGVERDSSTGAETAIPAPKPDLEDLPVASKSERQLACEKKKGRWAKIGKGDARACVFQTRDAGKRCTRESQCDGVCLARSGTCSPFKPLYGCNEILQDNGMRVTLCLD